jgi:hypothetical protein
MMLIETDSVSAFREGFLSPVRAPETKAGEITWPMESEFTPGIHDAAVKEFVAFCRAIVDMDPVLHRPRGAPLRIVLPDDRAFVRAKDSFAGIPVEFHLRPPLHGGALVGKRASADLLIRSSVTLPSPEGLMDLAGRPVVGSYADCFVGKSVMVVPQFGARTDAAALTILQREFPKHRVIGLSAIALLSGGKTFYGLVRAV